MSSHTTRTTLTPITAMRMVIATENLILIQPLTEEKCQQALFQMNPHKAPNHMGLVLCFFISFGPFSKIVFV